MIDHDLGENAALLHQVHHQGQRIEELERLLEVERRAAEMLREEYVRALGQVDDLGMAISTHWSPMVSLLKDEKEALLRERAAVDHERDCALGQVDAARRELDRMREAAEQPAPAGEPKAWLCFHVYGNPFKESPCADCAAPPVAHAASDFAPPPLTKEQIKQLLEDGAEAAEETYRRLGRTFSMPDDGLVLTAAAPQANTEPPSLCPKCAANLYRVAGGWQCSRCDAVVEDRARRDALAEMTSARDCLRAEVGRLEEALDKARGEELDEAVAEAVAKTEADWAKRWEEAGAECDRQRDEAVAAARAEERSAVIDIIERERQRARHEKGVGLSALATRVMDAIRARGEQKGGRPCARWRDPYGSGLAACFECGFARAQHRSEQKGGDGE